MSESFEIDLQLQWFCSGDLAFDYSEDWKCDVSLYKVPGSDGAVKVAPFLILKKGRDYKIGQLYDFEYDEQNNEYVGAALRHPSLIRQNYDIPYNMPADANFLGPMHAVNMMRIIRSIQARLCGDDEVMDDALGFLRLSCDEYEKKNKPAPAQENVVYLKFG